MLKNPTRIRNIIQKSFSPKFQGIHVDVIGKGAFFSSDALKSSYETVLVSTHENDKSKSGLGVGLITLNQPKSLNSLSDALFEDLIHAARALDDMDDVGSIVVTGKGKAFAAGANIPEMSEKSFTEAYNMNMFSQWADITKISKPIIAAVNGFALGGGCELAMMCDIIIASPNAKFGQPEVNLGIIPGAGMYNNVFSLPLLYHKCLKEVVLPHAIPILCKLSKFFAHCS